MYIYIRNLIDFLKKAVQTTAVQEQYLLIDINMLIAETNKKNWKNI